MKKYFVVSGSYLDGTWKDEAYTLKIAARIAAKKRSTKTTEKVYLFKDTGSTERLTTIDIFRNGRKDIETLTNLGLI